MESMKRNLILLVVSLVVLFIGYQQYRINSMARHYLNDPLPKDIKATVQIIKDKVIVKSQKGITKVLPIPRSGEIKIIEDLKGNISIQKPILLPKTVFLPQYGVSIRSPIEPLVGVQLLRSEGLQIGLSLNLTPSSISASLEKDLNIPISNTCLGLMYGVNTSGYTFFAIKWALFL